MKIDFIAFVKNLISYVLRQVKESFNNFCINLPFFYVKSGNIFPSGFFYLFKNRPQSEFDANY